MTTLNDEQMDIFLSAVKQDPNLRIIAFVNSRSFPVQLLTRRHLHALSSHIYNSIVLRNVVLL